MEDKRQNIESGSIKRISSLADHRALIENVFQAARRRILIVSPFISSSALFDDGIPGKVRKVTRRGVDVAVFIDDNLNKSPEGAIKPAAQEGIDSLVRSGAKITVLNGIHHKTLIMDDDLIAEGSFNWLSAVRTKGGVHQREERTMLVKGEEAKKMIEDEIAALEKMEKGAQPKLRKRGGVGILLIPVFYLVLLSGGFLAWYHFKGEGNLDVATLAFCVIVLTFVLSIITILLRIFLSDFEPQEDNSDGESFTKHSDAASADYQVPDLIYDPKYTGLKTNIYTPKTPGQDHY